MKTQEQFSIRARIKSFGYARDGIATFFSKEHNAVIHLIVTMILLLMCMHFPISRMEIIMLMIVTGGVWAAELVNTAIERIMDRISIERNPAIKQIKDLSAAAVLVMVLVALITGCIVFIPKF
jgi:diacylglycerol kinase (ATP)